MINGDALSATVGSHNNIARWILVLAGALSMAWAVAVFPTFSSEMGIIDVAKAITAGEAFKPDVLAAAGAQAGGSGVRSSILGRIAMIRLRLAEDAIRIGDAERTERSLEFLTRSINETLLNAPSDPFLWLARFWLDSTRNGLHLGSLRDLQTSYDLGRYEGWITAKRNGLALAVYSAMPSDLAELAISEFVGLVRWGFGEAVDIAAGPGLLLRGTLYSRLNELKMDQRRPFAQAMYGRDLDDVLVPGIAPPSPPIPMPILPPGF